jgi:hypothetical protein
LVAAKWLSPSTLYDQGHGSDAPPPGIGRPVSIKAMPSNNPGGMPESGSTAAIASRQSRHDGGIGRGDPAAALHGAATAANINSFDQMVRSI